MSSVVREINNLIKIIKNEIIVNDIDVSLLCSKLYLDEDKFVDIINNPRMNVSLYLEIVNTIKNMREV